MKRWIGCLEVLAVLLIAGTAMAQPPLPYHILHKHGAICDYNTGWNVDTPPYYPGTDWAVDFRYDGQGLSVLHKDGAIWNSNNGWILTTPPYYPSSNYARALEYLQDLSGCWCSYTAGWSHQPTEEGVQTSHFVNYYPNEYVQLSQSSNLITGQHCVWKNAAWDCTDFSGSVDGATGAVLIAAGVGPAANACWWELMLKGVAYWDTTRESFAMELAATQTDFYCLGTAAGTEEGWNGIVQLSKKYDNGQGGYADCVCPPPDQATQPK